MRVADEVCEDDVWMRVGGEEIVRGAGVSVDVAALLRVRGRSRS